MKFVLKLNESLTAASHMVERKHVSTKLRFRIPAEDSSATNSEEQMRSDGAVMTLKHTGEDALLLRRFTLQRELCK